MKQNSNNIRISLEWNTKCINSSFCFLGKQYYQYSTYCTVLTLKIINEFHNLILNSDVWAKIMDLWIRSLNKDFFVSRTVSKRKSASDSEGFILWNQKIEYIYFQSPSCAGIWDNWSKYRYLSLIMYNYYLQSLERLSTNVCKYFRPESLPGLSEWRK